MRKLLFSLFVITSIFSIAVNAEDRPIRLSDVVKRVQLTNLDIEKLRSAQIDECQLREVLKGDENEISSKIFLVFGTMSQLNAVGKEETARVFAIVNSDMGFIHNYNIRYTDWASSRKGDVLIKRESFGPDLKLELKYNVKEGTARLRAYNPYARLLYFTKTMKKAEYDCTLIREW